MAKLTLYVSNPKGDPQMNRLLRDLYRHPKPKLHEFTGNGICVHCNLDPTGCAKQQSK